jgi:hypothetical protein
LENMSLAAGAKVDTLMRQVSVHKDKVSVDYTVVVAVDGSEVGSLAANHTHARSLN